MNARYHEISNDCGRKPFDKFDEKVTFLCHRDASSLIFERKHFEIENNFDFHCFDQNFK